MTIRTPTHGRHGQYPRHLAGNRITARDMSLPKSRRYSKVILSRSGPLGVWGNWTSGQTWASWATLPAWRWDRSAVVGAYATRVEDTDTGTHGKSGTMLCVIPFGDAEAAYLWERDHSTRTGSGTHNYFAQDPEFFDSMVWRPVIPPGNTSYSYLYWGRKSDGSYGGTNTATTTNEEEYVVTGAHFISGNGAQTFDPNRRQSSQLFSLVSRIRTSPSNSGRAPAPGSIATPMGPVRA